MARDKMTEILAEAICVTPEEARAALEASGWRVPDAARLLQREQRARARKARTERESRRDGGWLFRGLGRCFAAVD